MNWRFEDTGTSSGVFNMEHDETLAKALVEKTGAPTIRVYGWHPPAISIGWNQSMEEIDLAKIASAGIDVVRRPTGGRAILHSDELTYSVAMRVKGRNILSVYEDIGRALIAGLHELGVSAEMEKSQPHFPSLYRTTSAMACFSSAGRYEIKCSGKKIIGSAQRRYAADDGEEIVLQHGSILLGPDHKNIINYLKFSSEAECSALKNELDEKTTDLSTVLDRAVTFNEISSAVLSGFKKTWSIMPEVVNTNITEREAAI
jgi:lipoate-protein ligase A